MRKIFVFTLLLMLVSSCAYAADWSKYESGRDNIRLDGYQGQPGYIEFTDGDGNTAGYMWISDTRGLVWSSPDAIDLTTTKLTDAVGVRVSTSFDGDLY